MSAISAATSLRSTDCGERDCSSVSHWKCSTSSATSTESAMERFFGEGSEVFLEFLEIHFGESSRGLLISIVRWCAQINIRLVSNRKSAEYRSRAGRE